MTGQKDRSGASLETLRAEIDKIDAEIHALIMARAEVVETLGAWKRRQTAAAVGEYFRPGREAQILRRLAARHGGPLPVAAVLALWRTLVSAFLRLQWPFQVAVADDPAARDLARQHFGAATPLIICTDPLQALAADDHTLAVLPDVTMADWWCAAALRDAQGPRIVARLPFFGPSSSAAYVVARQSAEPSGDDVTLVLAESDQDLAGQGLELSALATYKAPDGATLRLWALDGAHPPQAVRAAFGPGVHVVGGYARPLDLSRA